MTFVMGYLDKIIFKKFVLNLPNTLNTYKLLNVTDNVYVTVIVSLTDSVYNIKVVHSNSVYLCVQGVMYTVMFMPLSMFIISDKINRTSN